MNRFYRLVWNRSLAIVQVASELTCTQGSGALGSGAARVPRRNALAVAIAGLALACASAPAWSQTCTPTDPSQCGGKPGIGSRQTRSPDGGWGDGGGGDATLWITNTSEGTGSAASAGNGGNGSQGIFNPDSSINVTASGGTGGSVGATGSTGVAASVSGANGGAGEAAAAVNAQNLVGGGGGGGGAGVFINDGISSPIVASTITIQGGTGGVGGDATANSSNGNATNGDPGGGGGGGAGIIIDAGAGTVTLVNSGKLLGGGGGAGGNGGYAGGGGGGGDGLLVLGAGARLTNSTGGVITGGAGGNPGVYQDGTNEPGGYGGGGAGVNIVGTGAQLINNGSITGGSASSNSANAANYSQQNGTAGAGVSIGGAGATLTNNGSITGGSITGSNAGNTGTPGAALVATGGATVTNSGSIQGGTAGTVQADSVLFSGGGNTLTIDGGASFTGNIVSISGTTNGGDTLALGGSTNGTINPGLFSGFAIYEKLGASTWTLNGTDTTGINWTIQQGQLAGDTNAFGGNLAIANGASVDFNPVSLGIYSHVISGAGEVIKGGVGTLALTGTNTYTGGTVIDGGVLGISADANLGAAGGTVTFNGGMLQTTAAFTTARNFIINSGGGRVDPNVELTISGNITGSGRLTTGGSGTLTLSGTNSYSGGTDVEQDTLQGTTSSLQGDITDNGAVVFNQTTNGTYSGAISGAGTLATSGIGTVTLTGANTYAGGTTINAGTLAISSDANLGASTGTVTLNGGALDATSTLTTARAFNLTTNGGTLVADGDLTIAGSITGSGALTETGTGTLALIGINSYTGGTIIGGTLAISSDANLGASTGTVTLNGGTLDATNTITTARTFSLDNTGGTFQTDGDLTIEGNINGAGMLTKTGTGTLALTGANTYTGGTTISAGTLQGNTASLQGNITNNAALVFNQTTSGIYSGVISGSGTLTANGTGTLILDGANTASGLTTVASGATLIVGDSSHTTATVGSDLSVVGGTLGGYGTVLGSVTLSNSATLTPGEAGVIGSLTINGDLTIGDGSQLNFDFGAPGPNFSTPGQSDHVVVGGSLSIGTSTLNVNNLGSMGPGLYELFSWTNSLSITGGGFAPPSGMSIQILTVDKEINLIDTQNVTLDEWDANGLASPSQMGGGSGTWSISSNTWSNTNGQYVGPMAPQPGFAIFGGAAGTVTVDDTNGAVSTTGMQFVSDGYHLTGGAIDLVGQSGTAPVIRVSSGDTAIIDNVLQGTDGFNKTDGGTLVLTGTNTYTGTTTLSGGYLSVSSDVNLGASTNPLDFEGGTLEITGTSFNQTARTIIWGSTGGGFDIHNAANTFTVTQALTGTGGLLKSGAGTLVLTGSNTYLGDTVIDAGNLQLGNGGTTGSIVGGVVLNGGTLVFDHSGNDLFGGRISGNGSVIDLDANLTLSGAMTFTGTTYIAGAPGSSLKLASAAPGVSLASNVYIGVGNVFATGELSTPITLPGAISGPGAFAVTYADANGEAVTLTGTNTYTGGTTIQGNILVLGNGGTTGSIVGNVVLGNDQGRGAALDFFHSGSETFAGAISGSGALVDDDGGTLTLTGDNTFNGTTYVDTKLQLGNGGTSGSLASAVYLSSNSTLAIDESGTVTLPGAITGTGSLSQVGTGTTVLTGNNTYTGGTTISAGTLQGDTSSVQGNIVDNATLVFAQTSNGTFSGTISGSGQLIKNGSGTLILSGSNSYAGGTTINAGTLQGDANSLQGNITNNAALVFNQTSDGAYSGVISGSGSVTKTGTGTLSLTGANAYSGGTTISAGTLEGDTNSLQGNIVDNAALVFNQASNSTYSNAISGSGSLTKTGAGTLILDGVNTYTGSTTISAGTLEVGDSNTATASIDGAVDVQSGGTLRGHGTIVGDVTSDGIVWPGGSMGTLTIQGNYTQNADGTLQLDVTPAQSSLLKVSGNANLAGTLDLIFAPGTYYTNKYPLVQAGSVTGTFSTVDGTVPGSVKSQISYSATGVDLVLTQRSVMPLDSSVFGNLMRSVNLTSQQDMGSVLDVALMSHDTQCSGDHASTMQNVTASCGNGAWAQYTGSSITLNGSDGSNSTAFGLLGGADYAIGDIVHVGLQAGVGKINASDRMGGNGRVDNVHGGLYAYADTGPIVLSAVVDTMHSDYHFNRATGIGTATSTPGGNMLSAALQAAWPLQLAQWQLTPKVGALYQRQTLDGFTETINSTNPEAASFPVDGTRSRYTALQPYALMAVEHSFVAHGITYVPEVSLGYRYDTHNSATPVVQITAQDGTTFDLPGAAQGRGLGTASARITAEAGASWSLYADYQGFFGSRLHDNALSFGFTKHF